MRIFIASDLHLGVSAQGDKSFRSLAKYVNEHGTEDDVLMILGDIGIDDVFVQKALQHFQDFRGKKLAIAGNHDVWVAQKRDTSSLRYHRQSAIFRFNGFHPLEDEPIVFGDIGFAGAMGWHDRTFRDEIGIPDVNYELKTFPKGEVWLDAHRVNWPYTDKEVVEMQLERLHAQLEALKASGVTRMIVGMHHVPTKELLFHPRWLLSKKMRFFNTFLGSQRFGTLLEADRSIPKLVFCGHIHRSANVIKPNIRYHSVGGSYASKQLIILDESLKMRRKSF